MITKNHRSLRPEIELSCLATEAAGAVLEYGFGDLWLETIWAVADAGNRASLAVMRRLGMRYVESTDLFYGEVGELYAIEHGEFSRLS